MKREFLKELGLADEAIEKIMSENGKDINELKTASTTAQTTIADLQKQISDRDKQLETLKKSSGDNEALQAQITELQVANKTAKAEYDAQVKKAATGQQGGNCSDYCQGQKYQSGARSAGRIQNQSGR